MGLDLEILLYGDNILFIKLYFRFKCRKRFWYFNYKVPEGDEFVSFEYTTNINTINIKCNKYGYVQNF